MADMQFSIGGDNAPFMSALKGAEASAKESGAKITEAMGIEGVKSERALHGKLSSAFKDLTKNGTTSAEAIGGAFENMTEGLKLSMGSMVALLVVTELVKTLYEGHEAAEKFAGAIKDAGSVNMDVTNQSVNEINENIKKLKADADATNLGTMSALQAGATVVMQALEDHKSISATIKEDAEKNLELTKQQHELEDAAGTKAVTLENDVLRLKIEGKDKEAEAIKEITALKDKQEDADKKHQTETVKSLQEQIDLTKALASVTAEKEGVRKNQEFNAIAKQESEEQEKRSGVGKTDNQKLSDLQAQTKRDQALVENAGTANNADEAIAIEKLKLSVEKDLTAEKQLQQDIQKKSLDAFLKGNEKDAETHKKQLEVTERRAELMKDQQQAQKEVNATALDTKMFHGESSSLAKLGLGGRVSGANYGNQAQLKASEEAVKHLADVNKKLDKMAGSIGLAQ